MQVMSNQRVTESNVSEPVVTANDIGSLYESLTIAPCLQPAPDEEEMPRTG
jgi:hypothetical protein